MIVTIVSILLGLSVFIFCFCVYILLQKRQEKVDPFTSFHAMNKPTQSLSSGYSDYDLLYQKQKQEIEIKYPNILPMFLDYPCVEAMVLQFQGLSIEKEAIVYMLSNEEVKNLFLETIQAFIQQAKTPKYNIILAFPYTKDAPNNIISILQAKNISIKAIYTDASCMRDIPSLQGTQAFVGIGRKPYVCFEVKHDNAEHDWFASLDSYQLFTPTLTKQNKDALHCILKQFPLLQRMQYYAFPKQFMETCMRTFPFTTSWFLPVFEKKDNQLIVYCQDSVSLKQAIHVLLAYAKKQHIELSIVKTDVKTYDIRDDVLLKQLDTCICDIFHIYEPIHIYIEEDITYTTQLPIISFAPIFQNHVLSQYQAMQFYTKLLELR